MRRAALVAGALACRHPALAPIPPGAAVELPADHAPHPAAQTEWWHLHAALAEPATGEEVGVFAAFLVERTRNDRVAGLPVAPLVDPLRVAWVAIRAGGRTWTADRTAFPDTFAAGSGGAGLDLRHGDWRLRWEGGAAVLAVRAGPHRLDLRFEPTRSPTLPGEGGRVELVPGSAHLWAQMEGMAVRGRWRERGRTRWLEGSGFYKHQWGRLYDPGLDGFTWISADLPGVGELALAWLHADGMRGVAGSLGWLRPEGGEAVPLPVRAMKLEPTRTWRSRRSGATWPVAWRVEGPELALTVEAVAEEQELWGFPAPFWAGGARVRGRVLGREVDAPAFLEQAGARVSPLRALLRSDPPTPPGRTRR